ncbi:membrane protein [Streptomyces toyocaensis]|uniref:Membrane protein n=1 Tax=Streptomyces toyocaensis TaxID=55952 RepID=A0A081XNX5_STRTO|nr:hypothetical protein [Streptomyces toyocaensis]KES05248.1 membrane protein [Streptomyces toyocaensis]
MGTAERREAPEGGTAARTTTGPDAGAPGRGIPAAENRAAGGAAREDRAGSSPHSGRQHAYHRPLWVEEPARRRRLPDPVRTAAVRAVLVIAVTLIQAMVALLCTLAGSWLAFPMVISSVVSTILATWAALDVWVTRQVWNQRHGVVSVPSSTARALRRERRRASRQERSAERARARIRRRGGAGQLSHS